MKIYIVFESYQEDDSEPCLMEIFDSRKKARAYINQKKKEWKELSHRAHYYKMPHYEIVPREVL